jgi:hypothetical protein
LLSWYQIIWKFCELAELVPDQLEGQPACKFQLNFYKLSKQEDLTAELAPTWQEG